MDVTLTYNIPTELMVTKGKHAAHKSFANINMEISSVIYLRDIL